MFLDEIRDLYDAESNDKGVAEDGQSSILKLQFRAAFESHLRRRKGHVARLSKGDFDSLDAKGTGKKCAR